MLVDMVEARARAAGEVFARATGEAAIDLGHPG